MATATNLTSPFRWILGIGNHDTNSASTSGGGGEGGGEGKVKGVLDWAGLMSSLFTSPHEDMGVRHSADVWFVAMEDPRCDAFLLLFWGVLGSVICLLGLVGNCLAFVTFQRHYEPVRTPAQTLVQALCVSDCCLLALVLALDCASYACDYFRTSEHGSCVNPWTAWPYIRYVWVLTPVSHMCTAWFVVLIAANRYWAVCRAFDVDRIWTNRRTAFAVLNVIVAVIIFNLPRWFEYRVVSEVVTESEVRPYNASAKARLREERSDVSRTFAYLIGYKMLLVNLVLILAPLCLVAGLTSLILHRLYVNSQRPSTPTSWRSSAARVTRVLTAVVTVHVVCQTPLAVFNFVRYAHYGCGEAVFYLDHISKLLVNLNSCLNVILYCALSPKFRQSLCTLVCASQCRSSKYVSAGDLQQLRHQRRRPNEPITEAVPLRGSSVQRRACDEELCNDVIIASNEENVQLMAANQADDNVTVSVSS